MSKIVKIIYLILMAVSAVMVVLFYAGGEVPINIGAKEHAQPIYTEPYIVWGYILAGLSIALTVIFAVVQMIKNPRNLKKTIISVAFMGAVILLGYIFASTEQLNLSEDWAKFNVPSTLKQVGTGLITTYILAGLAIVTIVWTEVAKIFR